jgi:hypothetical protein
MWNNWHIVKFDYQYPVGTDTQSRLVAYEGLEDAQRLFDHLELGYQFNVPIRVKGGKMIQVNGVYLYMSFKENLADAREAVKLGTETLMQEAREIDVDL